MFFLPKSQGRSSAWPLFGLKEKSNVLWFGHRMSPGRAHVLTMQNVQSWWNCITRVLVLSADKFSDGLIDWSGGKVGRQGVSGGAGSLACGLGDCTSPSSPALVSLLLTTMPWEPKTWTEPGISKKLNCVVSRVDYSKNVGWDSWVTPPSFCWIPFFLVDFHVFIENIL